MEKEAARIEQTIHAFGPLPSFRATADALLDASGRDKKNRSGKRRFILPQGIGNSIVVEDVTEAELHSAIAWTLTTARQQKPVTEAAK
jgi:3-dehydroquinate synthase